MAKKKVMSVNQRTLGLALIGGLVIQFVFPVVGLGSLANISTLIYLVVAVLLLI